MIKNKLLLLLVLLMTAATGAWAQTTINVTAGDLGKAVCTDGSIYDNVDAAQSAGKTAAAKIICLDAANSVALALALTDQAAPPSSVNWSTAKSKCEALNTSLAVTGGTWVLPSKAQWEAMIEAAGGYSALRDGFGDFTGGGNQMQSVSYWSGTDNGSNAWRINFYNGTWSETAQSDDNSYCRACLVINLPQTYSVTLAEGTEDATNWTVPAKAAEGSPVTVTYNGEKKVKSVKAVKKAGYLKWDKGQEKLVETAIPRTANKVQNSDQNVEWAGTYVVEGDVTISGEIKLTGDVELIIKDGAKLTVTKLIHTQSGASLSVYGQTQMSGELNVTNSGSDAIMRITTLEVHSCKVKATSPAGGGGGVYLITTLNVYGGSLDAEHTGEGNGYGILLKKGGALNIYGGEVKAVGKGNNESDSYGIKSSSSSEAANVKVYGGKLWAECADNKAFRQINLTTEAGYTGKIQYSSDKSTWSKIADADAKYVRVEPADNTYQKWDADQKKLVKTDIQAPYTTVTSSTTTWPAGTYVVEDDVTISGTITLTGDVELIIKDAKLTVNQITGGSNKYNLSIYGQANQTGQLVVNKSDDTAIKDITKLEVHSAKVKATSSEGDCGGLYDIKTINVYGGSVDAENTGGYGSGIKLPLGGSMNIYGGDVKVVGKGNFSGIGSGSATTVTVDGGKLWAENASYKAINTSYVTLTTSSKIETSSDGNGWTEYTQASTPNAKYVRVGY